MMSNAQLEHRCSQTNLKDVAGRDPPHQQGSARPLPPGGPARARFLPASSACATCHYAVRRLRDLTPRQSPTARSGSADLGGLVTVRCAAIPPDRARRQILVRCQRWPPGSNFARSPTGLTTGGARSRAVEPEQEPYVATNARSIAEAHFEPRSWFRAIYADDDPVGFVMAFRDPPKEFWVWRFMIDAGHQAQVRGCAHLNCSSEEAPQTASRR